MNREIKAEHITQVRDKFHTATMAIVTEYQGLTVSQMVRLRREIAEASGEYRVIKNTLARLALKETAYDPLGDLLNGPNGWVLAYGDPIGLSKALVKFSVGHEKLKIKGGLLDGQFMDPTKVQDLARMPSKPELQAKLLALMNAPVVRLLRVMQEPGAMVVRLLDVLRKEKAGTQG